MKTTPQSKLKIEPNHIRKQASLALATAFLLTAASAVAQTYWQGGTSDYNVPASWTGIYNDPSNPNVSNDSGSNNVVLIQPGDPVWQHGDTLAGNAAGTSGSYLQTGSTNNTGGGNWFRLANGDNSYGSYVLSNGVVNVGGQTHIGERGVGYLEQDGGVFNTAQDPFCVGDGDWGPSPVGYFVMNGGTNNIASEFWIGEGNATQRGTGYFTMNGGVINVNFWWDIGRWGADGYFTMNGGTINKTGGGDTQWGAYNNDVPSSATVNMTGGTININNNLEIGSGGNGTVGGTCLFNQSGGTLHVGGEYRVANYNIASVATNNISGNAVLIVDNWLAVGRAGGVGTLNISGNASITKTGVGGNITLSGDNGGTSLGTINQNGGTLTNTATETWVAENYNGYWNLNTGADVLGVIHLTENYGAQGIFNLNGGDLTATEITDNPGSGGAPGGSGTLNLNGGTLHAGADTLNFMHDINGGVYVQAGGAIINTEGYDATIAQSLNDGSAGSGNLTKEGNGTLTLSGQNYYSGSTTISGGTLATTTGSFAVGAYTVADNAGFGVIVAYLNAQFYPASVTLGTSAGASLDFDLGAYGNPQYAPLVVNGNLALNGPITVNVADAAPVIGEFPLLSYGTKSGSGTFVLGTLPAGVTANLVPTANGLDLNITGVALDVWTGAASSDWDINSSINWINFGSSSPTVYEDGDQVRFDDTATGTTTVNLTTGVVPGGSVVFNNSTDSYTLTGNGSINGLIGVAKSGTNSVTILTTNNYTGATVLNDGLLVVSNLANGGSASAIGAATSDTNNLVFNGGTLSYGGPAMTWDRGFTLKGNYGINGGAGTNLATLDLQNDLTLTGPMFVGVNSSFVKSGPGTLTYKQVGTNQLSGGNDPGYQVFGGTVVFDGSAGTQVMHNQSEFYIGDTTNSGANIILTNTTLNVDSWFCLSRGNGDSGFVCNGNFYNSTLNCGNLSLGYNNGRANLNSMFLTLTNSTIHSGGNFNVVESAGSVGMVNITGNSIVTVNTGPMMIALASGATGAVVVADNSSLTLSNNWFSIGASGTGTMTIKDAGSYSSAGDFNVADVDSSEGTLNISDNATLSVGGLFVASANNAGSTATGTVNQTNGTVTTAYDGDGSLIIGGRNSASTLGVGVYNLVNGTVNVGGNVWLGGYGSGTINQTSGSFNTHSWTSIGRQTGGTGVWNISGGTLNHNSTGTRIIVGENGTGTLNVSGSAQVTTTGGLRIGNSSTANGTVNLDGGTITAPLVETAGGSSTLNFNGGVLKAGANAQLNFMTNITAVYLNNSSVIDTVTNIIAINSAIYDGGAGGTLTKNGSGTLLLDGANYYPGATLVTAGTLGGSGSLSGPLTVQSGASLAPGDNGIGILTAGAVTLAAGSTTVMEVNGTTKANDQLAASTVTYGGTLVLKNLDGQLAVNDTFTLFPTAGTGSFTIVSQTPGQTVTWDTTQLNVDGTVKVLTVTASTPPTITTSVATGVGGNSLTIAWPAGNTGYTLQVQSNPANVGLSTNWVDVAGSSSTNMVTVPIDPAAGSTFYRLVQ